MTSVFSDPSYLIPPLIGVIVTFIPLIVALLWSRRDFATLIFSGMLASLTLVNIVILGMRASPDIYHALLWEKALALTYPPAYVLYYHFTLVHTHNHGQRRILLVSYLFMVVCAALTPTNLMIKGMLVGEFGYAPIMGPMTYPMFIVGPLLALAGAYNLLKYYKASPANPERIRLIYLATAAVFPILGALWDGFTNLPPMFIWSNLIFCVLCSIAILRYRLLDIQIFIRKSSVFVVVSAIVAVPYVGTLMLFYSLFKSVISMWWIHAIILVSLAIVLRPLYGWAQNLMDRLFYGSRYNYLRALEQFSREARSIADLNELGSSLVKLTAAALNSSSVCLLLPFEGRNDLAIASCAGLDTSSLSSSVLSSQNPLVKWLKLHGSILSSEELSYMPELEIVARTETPILNTLRAELYVPIKANKDELSGILVLGEKLNRESYSNQDRQLLAALVSQMAMTLDNARLYQLEINAQKELEKQNEQKTEFLHSVAHELKTPLTAIIASSELFDTNLSSITTEQMGRLIQNISHSAWSMDRKVTDLLNLAKTQIEDLELKLESLQIGVVIKDAVSQLSPLFKSRQQSIKLEIPDLLPQVQADRAKIEQVLLNLLSNANKFSSAGENITLRVREADNKLVVELKDTAPAITKEKQANIFQFYYRGGDADERERIPGLGLGLAISKKLVELHQGTIWVESKLGEGNTFAFSLPILERRTNGIE